MSEVPAKRVDSESTALELLASLREAGALTDVALALPPTISWEQYVAIMEMLDRTAGALPWWIGDAHNLGEAKWGEAAVQATLARVSLDTQRTYGWVARRVEASERRPELKFSHHRAVAALPKRERTKWLQKAVNEGWRTRDLSANIAAATVIEAPEKPDTPKREVTPREALTAIRQDDVWREVADTALKALDAELVCPECGHHFKP